jgi:hypothetical protein
MVLGACARPSAPQPPAQLLPPAPPLTGIAPVANAGEGLTFSVSLRGVEGGRARVAIAGKTGGTIAARGQAESAGVVASIVRAADEVSTLLDAVDGRPQEVYSVAVHKGKEIRVRAVYDGDHRHAVLEVVTDGVPRKVRRRLPADAPTFDSLGAMMIMRGWRAEPGERARFYSLTGQRLWRVEITMGPVETINTMLGPVKARRVDGLSTRLTPALGVDRSKPPRSFTAWFSDDARALPVKIRAATEFGDAVAVLTSYQPGGEPTAEVTP